MTENVSVALEAELVYALDNNIKMSFFLQFLQLCIACACLLNGESAFIYIAFIYI